MRPANGQFYGVGRTSRLYQIQRDHRRATQIGPVFPTLLSGTRFGVDFNPAADRLRVVSDNEQNLRINPDTGASLRRRHALNRPGRWSGAAYTNNVDGAGSRLLYDIDASPISC